MSSFLITGLSVSVLFFGGLFYSLHIQKQPEYPVRMQTKCHEGKEYVVTITGHKSSNTIPTMENGVHKACN